MANDDAAKRTLIFSYGTLKRGFPNHGLMRDLILSNDAVFVGEFVTVRPYPLVVGPHGIPYLLNLPGSGLPVRGELYSVSPRALAPLDDLEGTAIGHYDRLSIEVRGGEAAEAYFAGGGFGERMWERKGKEAIGEYTAAMGKEYVRKVDRPSGHVSIIEDIESFIASH